MRTGSWPGPRGRERVYRALASAFAPPGAVRGRGPRAAWIADEYTRLFVAPRPLVYPYESMYDPVPRVMGETTLDVRRRYAAAGFAAPAWADLPDHLALELAFMAALAAEERRARARGDPVRMARTMSAERDFLQDHLIAWVPLFSEEVAATTRLPFFRELADRLRGWIPSDLDLVVSMAGLVGGR